MFVVMFVLIVLVVCVFVSLGTWKFQGLGSIWLNDPSYREDAFGLFVCSPATEQ